MQTLTGDFRQHSAFGSAHLRRTRDLLVYLPPGYDEHSTQRYPVLYLQDGQNLFDGATSFLPGQEWRVDETAEDLIRARKVEPVIIVGIYNAGDDRVDEYTPTANGSGRGGKAHLYAKFLTEELKPFIDSTYRTRTGPSDTAIGGSSLGGLLALTIGLTHPHVFGKAAVMSPSIWWDHGVLLRFVQEMAHKPELRIWLDTGSAEGRVTLNNSRALRDALKARGWRLRVDLRYCEAARAGHNEAAWGARVAPMLRWLFPLTAAARRKSAAGGR